MGTKKSLRMPVINDLFGFGELEWEKRSKSQLKPNDVVCFGRTTKGGPIYLGWVTGDGYAISESGEFELNELKKYIYHENGKFFVLKQADYLGMRLNFIYKNIRDLVFYYHNKNSKIVNLTLDKNTPVNNEGLPLRLKFHDTKEQRNILTEFVRTTGKMGHEDYDGKEKTLSAEEINQQIGGKLVWEPKPISKLVKGDIVSYRGSPTGKMTIGMLVKVEGELQAPYGAAWDTIETFQQREDAFVDEEIGRIVVWTLDKKASTPKSVLFLNRLLYIVNEHYDEAQSIEVESPILKISMLDQYTSSDFYSYLSEAFRCRKTKF